MSTAEIASETPINQVVGVVGVEILTSMPINKKLVGLRLGTRVLQILHLNGSANILDPQSLPSLRENILCMAEQGDKSVQIN